MQWLTDFPGGNGKLLRCENGPAGARFLFMAEPRNCPLAMWFHFRIANPGSPQAEIALANPHQTLGGPDWSGNRIVYCGEGQPWRRSDLPRRIESSDGQTCWSWLLPVQGDWLEVAHCYPYQAAELDATLAELGSAFNKTAIGLSMGGNLLERVYNERPEKDRPAVLFTARHHAGETPGSWVLDGVLREMAGRKELLELLTCWAIPFVDVDDVISGSYGKDPWPHDTNRGYHPLARPESVAVRAAAMYLKEHSARLLIVDLHAPSHFEQVSYIPLRGWDMDSPINPVGESFARLWNRLQDEPLRSPVAHVTPERGLGRYEGLNVSRWGGEMLGAEAVSVETSYQGNGKSVYTPQEYRLLGRALAQAVARWLELPGTISDAAETR